MRRYNTLQLGAGKDYVPEDIDCDAEAYDVPPMKAAIHGMNYSAPRRPWQSFKNAEPSPEFRLPIATEQRLGKLAKAFLLGLFVFSALYCLVSVEMSVLAR